MYNLKKIHPCKLHMTKEKRKVGWDVKTLDSGNLVAIALSYKIYGAGDNEKCIT